MDDKEEKRLKLKEKQREYRIKNREKLNEKQREYHEKNREKINENQREWRKNNIDKSRMYSRLYARAYRANNREAIREYQKQWEESVNRVDGTMLDKVWNDKDDSKDSGSVRGYFTGISFDSSGKIKRK